MPACPPCPEVSWARFSEDMPLLPPGFKGVPPPSCVANEKRDFCRPGLSKTISSSSSSSSSSSTSLSSSAPGPCPDRDNIWNGKECCFAGATGASTRCCSIADAPGFMTPPNDSSSSSFFELSTVSSNASNAAFIMLCWPAMVGGGNRVDWLAEMCPPFVADSFFTTSFTVSITTSLVVMPFSPSSSSGARNGCAARRACSSASFRFHLKRCSRRSSRNMLTVGARRYFSWMRASYGPRATMYLSAILNASLSTILSIISTGASDVPRL